MEWFSVILLQKFTALSSNLLVQFHQGNTLHDKNYHDITRLCEKFTIALPDLYKNQTNERLLW